MASETGFRVQELASITPADITWGSEPSIQIDCTISKRRKYDRQEIKPSTAKALRKLSAGFPLDTKVWPGAWWRQSTKMLRKDLEGLEEHTREGCLTFHSLRHTFVSRVVESGAPVPMVMRICRLSTPDLLRRYYHEDVAERRRIIDGL